MSKLDLIKKYLGKFKGRLVGVFFLTIFYTLGILSTPLILSFMIDQVIDLKPITIPLVQTLVERIGGIEVLRSHLIICALLVLFSYLFVGSLSFLRSYWNAQISEGVAEDLRNTLYDHLAKLPYSYHVKAKTGDLIQRCTSDINQIRRLLSSQYTELVGALCMATAGITILFNIYPKLAWVSFASLPFIVIMAFIFFKLVHNAFMKCDEEEGRMTDAIQSTLNGARVIKAFNREDYELDKCEVRIRAFRDLFTHVMSLNSIYWALSDTLCILQILLVVVVGIFEARKGNLTIGNFLVFISYESQMIFPIRNVGRILSDTGKVFVAMGRILEVLNEKEEDLETGVTPEIKGNIELEHVSFMYDDGTTDVLKDVSFSVKKGQTVAIMGPTGSGKSSLVHLLTRLYDYDSGSIKVDGVELKDIQRKYIRNKIGIVLQEPYLFSKSIMDNVRISRPDADMEQINKATRIASIAEVIESFDQGYNTLVGEKGVTLSGGQKQRLAIARTIINESPVIIFDDSLSAVDTQTDANIRKALKNISEDTTTFLITHRVNSAMDADLIVVLDEGRVVQSGTHSELIREEGLYKRIYEIQSRIQEVEA